MQLEEQTTRRLAVQTAFNVQPPPGYSLGPVRLTPNTAVVSGWESDVQRVKRLLATVNVRLIVAKRSENSLVSRVLVD